MRLKLCATKEGAMTYPLSELDHAVAAVLERVLLEAVDIARAVLLAVRHQRVVPLIPLHDGPLALLRLLDTRGKGKETGTGTGTGTERWEGGA